MSYALRNSLILIVALLLISAGGYLFIHFYQLPQIAELEEEIERKQSEYNNKSEIAEGLPELEEKFMSSKEFIENFDKTLFQTSNPDRIYRFLTLLSNTDPVEFDFTFSDSTSFDRYGVVTSDIAGRGSHRAVINFLTRIENSEPVQKINKLVLLPVNQESEYNYVSFTFSLTSYYDKMKFFNASNTPGISEKISVASHNPFFPHIRDVNPNTNNLVNVEKSQLVGIGNDMIYLIDQNGSMQTMKERDRAYLGRLETININEGYARFRLNKGGIIETITLEVER